MVAVMWHSPLMEICDRKMCKNDTQPELNEKGNCNLLVGFLTKIIIVTLC